MSKHLSTHLAIDTRSVKSMVHLGARLGLVGSAIMGFSYRQYAGASFTSRANLAKAGMPVFTITDNKVRH